ncbi:MAG: hypothetical protein O7D29_09930, partial [Gemmatimonadetes bacterium]|nr:hypothetical protein [Gemmatimonadota bacterium]
MNRRKKLVFMTVPTASAVVSRERADRLAMGFEIATAAVIPGVSIYAEPIFLSGAKRTVYITFVASGDTHDGARLLMRGEVDGEACTGGPGATPTAPGWQSINMMPASNSGASNCNNGGGGPGDCHDNSIIYTCCRNVKEPGPHTVTLRMASGGLPGTVFFEQAHVYVDSTKTEPGFCELP